MRAEKIFVHPLKRPLHKLPIIRERDETHIKGSQNDALHYNQPTMSRLVVVLVVLAAKTASCAFFDLTDVDDPLSLLWHTKGESGRRFASHGDTPL
jgi:hypothetical protein